MLKKCEKCGHAGDYRPRERCCKATTERFGQVYYCWGKLVKQAKRKAPKPSPQQGSALRAASALKTAEYWRAEHCELTRRAFKALQRAEKAEAEAKYHSRRAAVTDAELVAEKLLIAERKARKAERQKIRGMKIGKEGL